jgi:hypothetical protein
MADYIALTTFERSYVENQINSYAEFLKELSKLIQSIQEK